MKPLQVIAMGLVVLVLSSTVNGYDIYVDPIGWLLVLYGLRTLPDEYELRFTLRYVGGVAAIASVPLWVPAVIDALGDADPSLAWAADLPRFGFLAVLCLALARSAEEARDRRGSAWWRTLLVGVIAVVALPVLVFGGGLTGLEATAGFSVALVPLVMIVLLFVHSGRAWAGAQAPESATNEQADGP